MKGDLVSLRFYGFLGFSVGEVGEHNNSLSSDPHTATQSAVRLAFR